MDEIIKVQDQFYILATSSRVDEHSLVLKEGDTFGVFDRYGNIERVGMGEQGLYHEGTRFLSALDLRIMGRRPLLLSSTVKEDNLTLNVDLTNPDYSAGGEVVLQRDQVHLFRCSFLWQGVLYQQLRLRNYSLKSVDISFQLSFDADYVDIFEVRGAKRSKRGELNPPLYSEDRLQLSYRGLDDVIRRTTIAFSPAPKRLEEKGCEYRVNLPAHGEQSYFFTFACESSEPPRPVLPFEHGLIAAAGRLYRLRDCETEVHTSNEQCNDWINRSKADVHLMVSQTPDGPYPYAGVPWFNTVFGRDGILTALECLWFNPGLARGVLAHLAANQATSVDPAREAEPGKILHETRRGEMAALGEIPFGRYYGSVDATPLFVMLAGAYWERTADRQFLESLWPHIEAALDWIDRYGDSDGDGFTDYVCHSAKGLTVQGWKDSVDSVFHADGTLAEGPVAFCEVQGYVYAARQAAAQLAQALGEAERSSKLVAQAEDLRERFEEAFWCEDLSTYALALDGKKQPCRVRTSNPGHCLFTGIASTERAGRVAATLLSDPSFSGWGIRTVAETEARYNPMAYHNGSIWPHDNAIIAAGLSRYGLTQHVAQIFTGLFDVSLFVNLHRMPELFCGFARRPGEGPTLYPVACAPQSWAAAAVFSLLQSLMGLSINAPRREIRFQRAMLPESIKRIQLSNLRVADSVVDVALERFAADVGVELLGRRGDVEVVLLK
jgi:glycogen debranching enzyme